MRILENARKEATVEIREFERAFRAAMGDDLMRPALAAPGISGQIDVQLPPEFQAAAKTLASRSSEQSKETSILRAVAAQWA
jgi:hypothetical protein